MDNYIVGMMLGASIFLGGIALIAFLWAVKNGQFDDKEKFLNGTKFDNVEDLNDAVNQEHKLKELKKKKEYRPE
jgi:cbb3-type cytochrome oxidase maturation protein